MIWIALGVFTVVMGFLWWILLGPGARRAEDHVWQMQKEERRKVAEKLIREWKVSQMRRRL